MRANSTVALIVVSKGRPAVLKETLEGFPLQTLKASQIVVVVTCDDDLPPQERPDFIEFYIGKPGICRQRNHGLEKIAPGTDYVAFFDDDMELKPDYLEKAVNFLDCYPAIVAITGWIERDGDISREEARRAIAEYRPKETYRGTFIRDVKHTILYGCAMVMRGSVMKYEKFDENLPLYAYGEDYDISMRLRRYGFIGKYMECVGVHLASSGGRINEVQRGYSMIANNWYFIRKGVCHLPPMLAHLRFWTIVFGKHLVLAFWDMLKGNKPLNNARRAWGYLIGVGDVLRGRSSPERMLDFSK